MNQGSKENFLKHILTTDMSQSPVLTGIPEFDEFLASAERTEPFEFMDFRDDPGACFSGLPALVRILETPADRLALI